MAGFDAGAFALAIVLMVVGVKMMTHACLKSLLGPNFNLYLLGGVLLILAAGVAASMLAARRGPSAASGGGGTSAPPPDRLRAA